jgi:CheY-like chemotaxis protein
MAIRILIADDNDLVRHALRHALESAGQWEITEAANGEEAVTRAREINPHLVILDLAMPVMDGIRAARAINLFRPPVPIILHTLHWSPRVELEALKTGVRRVVAKSNTATIIAAVEDLLSPELLGYMATVEESPASPANITVIRPAARVPLPPSRAASEAEATRKSADEQVSPDTNSSTAQ